MKATPIHYPFEVRPLSEEEGGGYGVSFPDLPGCVSDGATPEEAIANGRDALDSWLAVAVEFGDAVPMPNSTFSGRFVQRVPRSLHAQLIECAKAEGVSLNTLVVSLVAQGLGRRQAETQKVPRPARTRTKTARSSNRVKR
jgi:antitoxin HicB